MARPASIPTIMATDFPTWSSSLEDSAQNAKLIGEKQWSELLVN